MKTYSENQVGSEFHLRLFFMVCAPLVCAGALIASSFGQVPVATEEDRLSDLSKIDLNSLYIKKSLAKTDASKVAAPKPNALKPPKFEGTCEIRWVDDEGASIGAFTWAKRRVQTLKKLGRKRVKIWEEVPSLEVRTYQELQSEAEARARGQVGYSQGRVVGSLFSDPRFNVHNVRADLFQKFVMRAIGDQLAEEKQSNPGSRASTPSFEDLKLAINLDPIRLDSRMLGLLPPGTNPNGPMIMKDGMPVGSTVAVEIKFTNRLLGSVKIGRFLLKETGPDGQSCYDLRYAIAAAGEYPATAEKYVLADSRFALLNQLGIEKLLSDELIWMLWVHVANSDLIDPFETIRPGGRNYH